MVVSTIKTGVDELIELLKKTDRITVQDAAKKLNVSQKILQRWVDFLVEERIISIEYKFTVPYIYYNKDKEEKQKSKSKLDLITIKKSFYDRAKKKKISEDQIKNLWQKKLMNSLNLQKAYFYKYAQTKSLQNIEQHWNNFQNTIFELNKKWN